MITSSHSWVDATCVNAKTCTKCQKTEGNALGHTGTVWEYCSRCKTKILPPINLPTTPFTLQYRNTIMKITDLSCEHFAGDIVAITITAEKVSGNGTYFEFRMKVVDKDGVTTHSNSHAFIGEYDVGEKFTKTYTIGSVKSPGCTVKIFNAE